MGVNRMQSYDIQAAGTYRNRLIATRCIRQKGADRTEFARPLQFHQCGTGSNVSVFRLSAQAWTA